jgi:hypothetical protein
MKKEQVDQRSCARQIQMTVVALEKEAPNQAVVHPVSNLVTATKVVTPTEVATVVVHHKVADQMTTEITSDDVMTPNLQRLDAIDDQVTMDVTELHHHIVVQHQPTRTEMHHHIAQLPLTASTINHQEIPAVTPILNPRDLAMITRILIHHVLHTTKTIATKRTGNANKPPEQRHRTLARTTKTNH